MSRNLANVRITHRRDTHENWSLVNPVLLDGELGVSYNVPGFDTIMFLGDGSLTYQQIIQLDVSGAFANKGQVLYVSEGSGGGGGGGGPGASVFIRYSEFADGTNFTENWLSNQSYLGLATGFEAPTSKEAYQWSKFVGNYVDIYDDNISTSITHDALPNIDTTFKAANIGSLNITIPSDIAHGYYSGVNFISSNIAPILSVDNRSSYDFKYVYYGNNFEDYKVSANHVVALSIYCDGINVYCYINEVK